MHSRITAILSSILLSVSFAIAQSLTPPPLAADQRTAIVDSVARILTEQYVFPDVGKRMGEHIRKLNRQGAYGNLSILPELTQRLTEDLRSISKDLHLQINVLSPDDQRGTPDSLVQRERELHRQVELDRELLPDRNHRVDRGLAQVLERAVEPQQRVEGLRLERPLLT